MDVEVEKSFWTHPVLVLLMGCPSVVYHLRTLLGLHAVFQAFNEHGQSPTLSPHS